MEKHSCQKLKLSKMFSILTIVLGTTLLIPMFTVKDKPSALPMILILIGILWFMISLHQNKKMIL